MQDFLRDMHGEAIRVRAAPSASPVFDVGEPPPANDAHAAATSRAWVDATRTQPRLFDGPMLFVDAPTRAVRGTYKALVAAAGQHLPIRSLGAQGLVIARDRTGHQHLLLGRRSGQTRSYPGLWENAPSGTMTPPPPSQTRLTLPDFAAALRQEGIEELGIDLADADIRWLAMLEDPGAHSDDVVLEVRLHQPIDPRASICATADGRWEYADAAWIALSALSPWAADHAHAISPPTLALFGWLGWLE